MTEEKRRLEALRKDALHFLLSGGHLTRFEWSNMSAEEKAAHVVAGRQLRSWQAYLIGTACSGKRGALSVLSDLDGGQAHDAWLIEEAARGKPA